MMPAPAPTAPAASLSRRRLLQAGAALGLLGGCAPAPESKALVVGGLPVTCNLTLPIACTARAASLAAGAPGLPCKLRKFSGWPELKETLMSGRIEAAYMLAPLVMDLVNAGIPLKIVSLGHRSGAVIMVRTDSPYRRFADLRGLRIAIPSRFAVDDLFLRRMLAREGMRAGDVRIFEMAPPDMPPALYANAIDADCTGEPFGAAAERAGYARPLAMTRAEWPNYICCVLTVRQRLIDEERPLVQDLVNSIQAAGNWLDADPVHRQRAAQIAAGRTFFNQDPGMLRFVLDHPADRVTYGDLRMVPAEFDDLLRLSLQAGTVKQPLAFERYVDASFVRAVQNVPVTIA
jgi:NitT/TauT family transport system substrate-binding protein